MVPEAPLAETPHGRVPAGDGWFVVNAAEARWEVQPGRGATCEFEGEERPLRAFDLVHCPAGTAHSIVGAGDASALVLAVGARTRSAGSDWGRYVVDAAAVRHGAGLELETTQARVAYGRFPPGRPTRCQAGWLPPPG
jgi:hypothetical protein